MRRLPVLIALAIVLAACGGAATPEPTSAAAPTSSTPAATAPAAPNTTETPTTAMVPTTAVETLEPAGPPAPDFQLELSDGATFVLSQEQKPVYLVFWAEW